MSDDGKGRPYRKRKRARQEEETRRRITEAVVELHRTVGPSETTVTEVAERAGVSRVTVYNHFPTEADLIEACSAHWSAGHPPPDPAAWSDVADPAERATRALAALYAYYRGGRDMLGNVFRDLSLVEPLGEIMDARWRPYAEAFAADLVAAFAERAADPKELVAAVRLAMDFHTWRVLADAGLGDSGVARLAARMVAGAAGRRADGAGP